MHRRCARAATVRARESEYWQAMREEPATPDLAQLAGVAQSHQECRRVRGELGLER